MTETTKEMTRRPEGRKPARFGSAVVKTVLVLLCAAVTIALLSHMVTTVGSGTDSSVGGVSAVTIMDKFDMFTVEAISVETEDSV